MTELTTPAHPLEAGGLGSLTAFQEYHWLTLKVFHVAAEANHGAAGLDRVADGMVDAGHYRGVAMHDAPAAFVTGRGVTRLLEQWDTAEWELAAAAGELTATVEADAVVLTLPEAPGRAYLRAIVGDDDAVRMLDAYWPATLGGIATGYGEGVTLTPDPAAVTPWTLRVGGPGVDGPPRFGPRLADPEKLIALNRRTTGLLAAANMYVSRALVRAFDASGDETVRQAAYRFGADRGSVIRDRILAQGKPLTMANFGSTDGLQERDPVESVFVFRSRQHLSDGAYYLDCTYCPLAEVWASEGEEGLRLGYLFDSSNHRGLFQSYNPETEVRWTTVKSRGDQVCRFRFTVPSLLTADDPTPEEFDAGSV